MTPSLLVHAIVVGASLLGLWVYVRLGERRPRSFWPHVVAALAALVLAPYVIGWIVGHGDSAPKAAAGLFGVFLPTMTYVFLAALFVFERLQRAMYMR